MLSPISFQAREKVRSARRVAGQLTPGEGGTVHFSNIIRRGT
jgi:hypothetical protein